MKVKNRYLILFIGFLFFNFYVLTQSYNNHYKKMETLTYQFNKMIYNCYINKLNYNINTGYLIKDMYIYNKSNNTKHFIKKASTDKLYTLPKYDSLKPVNDRFSEKYIDKYVCSVIYDKKLNNFSVMYVNVPSEGSEIERDVVIILLFFIFFIFIILYNMHSHNNNLLVNERLSETINLFKDTSFIVANVNHEINTPLTSIETSLYLLEKKMKSCKKCTEINYIINTINRDIEFIKAFILKLSSLKMLSSKVNDVNLYNSLEKIKNTVANITTTKLNIKIDIKLKNIDTKLSNEYVYSIFINLLKNSYEADASVIGITVIDITDKITILYNDNGTGIKIKPPEKIFNKNVSSKNKIITRGFGMFFIRHILDKYNCSINIIKTNNDGTTFKIELPKSY